MPSIDSSTETYLITLPTTTLNDKDTLQYVNNPITLQFYHNFDITIIILLEEAYSLA